MSTQDTIFYSIRRIYNCVSNIIVFYENYLAIKVKYSKPQVPVPTISVTVTSYQCMDCGECFIVRPSLIKHLIYYHEITDTEKYFSENSCFDEKAIMKNRSRLEVKVDKNQCKVCMRRFSNSTDLDTHFRTHGMAFLMRSKK